MLTHNMHRHHKSLFQAEEAHSYRIHYTLPHKQNTCFYFFLIENLKNMEKIEEKKSSVTLSELTIVNILAYITSFLWIKFILHITLLPVAPMNIFNICNLSQHRSFILFLNFYTLHNYFKTE